MGKVMQGYIRVCSGIQEYTAVNTGTQGYAGV